MNTEGKMGKQKKDEEEVKESIERWRGGNERGAKRGG